MKALVALLIPALLGQAWCCCPLPGGTNIARGGEASQSSNYQDYYITTATAEKAIDGVNDMHFYAGFCSCTYGDREPWWRLDLKQRYKVTVVVVSGRSDCCTERMKGLQVRIGDSPDNNNPLCANVTSYFGVTTSFWCNGTEGQYVTVMIPGREEYLTLCEVKVFSVAEENDSCC